MYENRYWWSDAWDALSYGRDFDFSRTFYEQFQELQNVVPQLAMMNDDSVASQNCQYVQDNFYSKNCYLLAGGWFNENCMYSQMVGATKEGVDVYSCYGDVELVYECIHTKSLYNCAFLQDSENCSNCFFGYGLQSCKDCFACVNLRQKQYCIFNEQYSKEEYQEKLKEFDTGSFTFIQGMKAKFEVFKKDFPRRNMRLKNCEECTGDHLYNSRECKNSFEGFDSEFCSYFVRVDTVKNCHDIISSGKCEWCYNNITSDESYMTHFSTWCLKSKYILYSDICQSSEYCFGCVGLKRKKYCIFNKQYTKEEYEVLVPKIIEHMKSTGEWGEFFKAEICPFAYNETLAQDFHPLSEEEAKKLGYRWKEEEVKLEIRDQESERFEIPDKISEVREDILTHNLVCEVSGATYKIIPAELSFYKKMKLPVPRRAPAQRYRDRMAKMNPIALFERNCDKCGATMKTTFVKDNQEVVYCEKCFLESVY